MKKIIVALVVIACLVSAGVVHAWSSSKTVDLWIGTREGTLTTNAWLSSDTNGAYNIRDHDYQVSAVYSGSQTVTKIQSKWKVCMNVRDSVTVSIGVSSDPSITAGASTSWSYKCSGEKYWINTNGAKSSSWRASISASQNNTGVPDLFNTALVWVKNDTRYTSVSTGV